MEINDLFSGFMPQGMIFKTVLIILLIFAATGVLFLISKLLINYFKYNLNIILFKKIKNDWTIVGKIKGFQQRINLSGDSWIQCRNKKIIPRPKIAIAKNTYWYFEREDGEWINFGLKDLDQEMRLAGAKFLDEDMRLARTSISKIIDKKYTDLSFFQKYGQWIVISVAILIIVLGNMIYFNKLSENMDQATSAAETAEKMAQSITKMAEKVEKLALNIDNLAVNKYGGVKNVNVTNTG